MDIYYSFVAVPENQAENLLEVSQKIISPHQIIKTPKWHFLFKGQAILPQDQVQFSYESHDYFFIGEIYNSTELRVLLAKYSSNALTCPSPELLYMIDTFLGKHAFSLVEGPFTFIKCHDKDLTVFSDSLGYLPVNVIFCESLWVTSELKMVAKADCVHFDFIEPKQLIATHEKRDDFLPIKNAIRLKPGQVTWLRFDGRQHPYINSVNFCNLTLGKDQQVSKKEACDVVFHLLNHSIEDCIRNEARVSLPLSGGIDSSLVAALTAQKVGTLHTYSIGSEESNEFQYSNIVAKHLNTSHQEFILSNKDILNGIAQSVYYNELFDGLSAEIQSGLFNLYQLDKGLSSAMITGYGADLLFGGVLDPSNPLETANKLLWQQIYRTRWTGEFSSFGALHYGVKIKHPFWNLKLISYCLNLDPALKIANGEVKTFIREYVHIQHLLPEVITWRKKIGIHEGSSKNKIFARIIGVDSSDYEAKTLFTYQLYKKFLTCDLIPEEFDASEYAPLMM